MDAIDLEIGSDDPIDDLDLSSIGQLKAEGFFAAMQKPYGVK